MTFTENDLLQLGYRPADSVHPLLRVCLKGLYPWANDSFLGWQSRDARIEVLCPYCKKLHYHGIDTRLTSNFASFKLANCLCDAGYWLSPWPESAPEAKGHLIRPGHAIIRPKIRLPLLSSSALSKLARFREN